MDASDYAFIEDHLKVTLPVTFKQLMVAFPNEPAYQLRGPCDELPCSGELFAIRQLQGFFNPFGLLDFYELQRELRSRRFVEIGGDGCGNYFCMVGDDGSSDEFWLWEHDPYNGFQRHEQWTLTDYLAKRNWHLESQPDPYVTVKGTYILRADHPLRGILNPIPLGEWLDYVDRQDFLQSDENHIGRNPFTGEAVVSRRWPGRATLLVKEDACYITYGHGALFLDTVVAPDVLSYIERIANDLDGTIWSGTTPTARQ